MNAWGKDSPMVRPHAMYLALGSTWDERLIAYRELFRRCLDESQIHAIEMP